MSASILDPRMIDPDKPLTITNTSLVNVTATRITTPFSNSDLWSQAYTIVSFLSTSVVTNSLSSTNTQLTNLSVSTPVIANYDVTTVTTSRTFTNADNSKVFHFDTTTANLCAIFPTNLLSSGFNVGIVNVGTGTVFLSANSTINAPGTQNSTRFTGMFLYEIGTTLFGVGVFD